jgi:S1-C subfamily serine protease
MSIRYAPLTNSAVRAVAFPLAVCSAILAGLLGAAFARADGIISQPPPEVEDAELASRGVPKGVDDLRLIQARLSEIVPRAQRCTVAVRSGASHGSGVLVRPDGYILTAGHVADRSGSEVEVTLPDGRTLKGTALGVNLLSDVGMVRLANPGPWPYLELGDVEGLRPGHWCISLGHPGGFQDGREPVVRIGRILAKRANVLLTDCTLTGGDSGGPLVDMHGRVIGIHSRIGEALTANLHVPINLFRESWGRLVQGQQFRVAIHDGPYLGVFGEATNDQVRITRVSPDSPAAAADLQVGDVIVTFAEKGITSFDMLLREVRDTPPGARVPVIVRRNGSLIERVVEIGNRSS